MSCHVKEVSKEVHNNVQRCVSHVISILVSPPSNFGVIVRQKKDLILYHEGDFIKMEIVKDGSKYFFFPRATRSHYYCLIMLRH